MQPYSLIAPAKINLYLEIIGDRSDGYHELAMILQSIELADHIRIRALGTDQIKVHCNNPHVPNDQSNLAYRAAALMAKQFPDAFSSYGGVEIYIQKNIPIGAGLAGGSTNAAAVLVGLDLMWKLGLTQSEIQELGAMLGSDIPFCVTGGTAIATGRGEKLAPLPDLDHLYLVLAKYRSVGISTAWAYQTYRKQFGHTYESAQQRRERSHCSELVTAISHRDSAAIGQQLHNDLEKVVLPAYPQVAQLRDALRNLSSLGGMMSGSGSTVFALAESRSHAEQICHQVRSAFPDPDLDLWVTKFITSGIQIDHD